MAVSRKCSDLKYDDETINIETFLTTEDLPAVVKVNNVESEDGQTSVLEERSILMQRISQDPFAHIKVLKFYDNAKMQSEMGGEYVLEHDTFVGKEYLMPLKFPGQVRFVRRPGSRGRYLTIKQVIGDCPAFVKAENETKARLSSDMTQDVTIPAKAILELKRIYTDGKDDGVLLECSDGDKLYTFHEYDEVNFTVFEGHKHYSLTELSQTTLLPKVVLFREIDPEDAVLKDNELRSALLTMVEGPLEVLGFVEVEYLICWIRNKERKTYETLLIPENMWNKIYVQKRCFTDEFEKEIYIKRRYKQCLTSEFLTNSLYILPVHLSEVTWLRSPGLFKRNLDDPNKLYEVVAICFEDSSDDDDDVIQDNVYAEITEPPPPLPPKVPVTASARPSTVKRARAFLKTVKDVFTSMRGHVMESRPERPPKPQLHVKSETLPRDKFTSSPSSRPLPFPPADKKYTKLKFQKSKRVYDAAKYSDKCVANSDESVQSHIVGDKTTDPEDTVLKDNQTAENFFKYSVREVSFCFEHCGLKSLADVCSKQMLDGKFFKGFNDWNLFNLSRFDVAIVNKVIYHGWRPKTDHTVYSV